MRTMKYCCDTLEADSPRSMPVGRRHAPRRSARTGRRSTRTRPDRRSMCALGLVQGRARILGQVRMQELGRLRNGEVQIIEILQLRLQPLPAAAEEMPATLAVVGQEMQMPAGDIDTAGIGRRPEAHDGAGDVLHPEL